MNTMVRVTALVLASLVLAMPVYADGPGTISGQVVNGTAGGVVTGGLQVALGVYQGDNLEREVPTQADEDGRFQFDGLDVGADFTYQVGTAHGEMLYRSDPVKLTESQPEQQVSLKIYEQTPTDPGVRASQVFVSLNLAKDNPQDLVVNELVRIVNPSDRTFAPQPGGAAGPMGLLRFGLPTGAKSFQPGFGLDPQQVIQVDRGFGSVAPVPPGDSVFRFGYRVPFGGAGDVLEKSLPYGAELLRVMTEEGGPHAANPALAFEQAVDASGVKVLVWAAHDVPAGTRFNIELSDPPSISVWARIGDALMAPSVVAALPWVLAGLVGLLPVLGVFWSLRGRAGPRGYRSTKQTSRTPEAVAEALVELDDASALGQVSGREYRKRRDQLENQLRNQLIADQVPLEANQAGYG